MKTKQTLFESLLVSVGALIFVSFYDNSAAQSANINVLYSFSMGNGVGIRPQAALTLSPDNNLYGTTDGGSGVNGTVFKATVAGTVTLLASIDTDKGAFAEAGLSVGGDGQLYGMTPSGGSGFGSLFRVPTNGVLIPLVSFAQTNGQQPTGLVLAMNGDFYGTTATGGRSGLGTVFKLTTNGTVISLASFAYGNGANPQGGLVLGKDGTLYGTTYYGGGGSAQGTVFKMATNGAPIVVAAFTGTNGLNPNCVLVFGDDGSLYGTTEGGGFGSGYGSGTLFRITTNGTLTTLVSLNGTNGAGPQAGLTKGTDGNFYGTTYSGGVSNLGTVFKMTPAGVLTTLASFYGTNGAHPSAALTLGADGNLYGTTYGGGTSGLGTIFVLRLPLTIQSAVLTNGNFNFNFQTEVGKNYAVEQSTNMAAWTVYTNVVGTGTRIGVEVPLINGPSQFFRVRSS